MRNLPEPAGADCFGNNRYYIIGYGKSVKIIKNLLTEEKSYYIMLLAL